MLFLSLTRFPNTGIESEFIVIDAQYGCLRPDNSAGQRVIFRQQDIC